MTMTPGLILLSGCAIFSSWHNFVSATNFQNIGDLSEEEAKDLLMKELKGNFRAGADENRVPELEAALQRTWKTMPKTEDGLMEHSAVRYMLHRLFMDQHGWFIRGLEPTSDPDAKSSVHNSLKEWAPAYLQDILEHLSGTSGMNLHQLAVLAATVEDLVHREAKERLEAVLPLTTHHDEISEDDADEILSKYLMVYLMGGNISFADTYEADKKMGIFSQKYTGWTEVRAWLQSVQDKVVGDQESYNMGKVSKVVEEVSKHFVDFNDVECKELKTTLLKMEGAREGRIRLADFYKQGLHSHWNFNEKIDYLRVLGAIDDSNPQRPYVIVPNYVGSRPNCLEASKFYAVCCRNECEGLMGELEKQIQAPSAPPSRILSVVASLSSDTVKAPRTLPESLVSRLTEVATSNDGEVPLHGRLFAQWMHHAFPRECPYPHDATMKTSPLTPDEWMTSTGEKAVSASQEDVMSYMADATCKVDLSNPEASSGCGEAGQVPDEPELPWIKTEVLVGRTKPTPPPAVPRSTFRIEAILVAGVAFGLVLLSWSALGRQNTLHSMESNVGFTKTSHNIQQRTVGWWINLMLYIFPLSVLSVDLIVYGTVGDGVLKLALCWGLVVMVGHALVSKYGLVPVRKAMKQAADHCLPFDNGKYCV